MAVTGQNDVGLVKHALLEEVMFTACICAGRLVLSVLMECDYIQYRGLIIACVM